MVDLGNPSAVAAAELRPAKVPRDRVYTLCGYRVPSSYVPRFVIVDGEERPEYVPTSVNDVCINCLLKYVFDIRRSLQAEIDAVIDAVINECRAKRLGMLGYGNCWRLWTQITGHTW